ncbi:MAG: hypothetical protein QOE70_3387 [Chthoniobacter sp.]|jgi:hypothetical protein|nr:hypothetical protein [Chthoniobacter sp.]
MTFNSFKLAISLLLLGSVVNAQQTEPATVVPATPAPAASTPPRKPRKGYFRFWNMLSKPEGELTLIRNDGSTEGTPLLSAAPNNYYASYLPLPPARYALKVVRRNDPATAIQSFDVTLGSDAYVTFMAHPVAGQVRIELFDDTFNPAEATSGRLTIRQFVPNANVTVTSNAQLTSRSLTQGETQTIEGFPLKPVMLKMRAGMAAGPDQEWVAEVNFTTSRRASLLIVSDPYGRFRPRVTIDGPHRAPAAP